MSTHGPIEERHHAIMNAVADALAEGFDGYGFALFVFDFDTTTGRINYISNAQRETMLIALKEFIARHEGMDVDAPTARQ